MPREIDSDVRAQLEEMRNPDPVLYFVKLWGAGLEDPLYFVNDNATVNGAAVSYVYEGKTYLAFPFDLEILTDNDQAPTGKVSIVNIDRQVGEVALRLNQRPRMEMVILPASDFDLTVNPRTLLASARPIYTATGLEIRNIKVDAMTVTGEIVSVDDVSEPWPALRASEARLPGLFR